jgi:hypothetical protein
MKTDWAKVLDKIDGDIARTRQRLEDLRAAREALRPLLGPESGVRRSGKRARPDGGAPDGARRPTSRLPAAGGRFWLDILGDAERTGREIVDLALSALKLGEEHRDAIYARAAKWFNGAAAKSLVQVVGEREGANVYRKI